jgi:hypothetical protein
MKTLLIAGAIITAVAATASTADAGNTGRNGYYQYHRSGDVTQPRRGAFAYTRECLTDEGYGRFAPCSGRGR